MPPTSRPRLRRALRRGALLLLVLGALGPGAARAQYAFEEADDLDHRGQWGVEVAPVLAWLSATDGDRTRVGGALAVDVSVSRALADEGDELSLRLRAVATGPSTGAMILGGYRTYFGWSHWKTYADVEVLASLVSAPAFGGRVGLGVMYDPSRRIGVSLSGGAYAAAGFSFVTGFDALVSVQVRF